MSKLSTAVSKLHLPTLRALAYARATRPDALEAIAVNVDDIETRYLGHKWLKALQPQNAPGDAPRGFLD